jgi:hypothetical protein
LESWRQRWDSGILGQVVDTNPRLSLIKFYSAMGRVGQLVRSVADEARTDPGWSWSAESRQKIEEAERLFRSSVQTIDASELPESIRENTQEEAALKLKEILDYVLSNAETPIELPNRTEKGFWRLPGSMIALASKLEEGADVPSTSSRNEPSTMSTRSTNTSPASAKRELTVRATPTPRRVGMPPTPTPLDIWFHPRPISCCPRTFAHFWNYRSVNRVFSKSR